MVCIYIFLEKIYNFLKHKKQLVHDLLAPLSIYIYMCTIAQSNIRCRARRGHTSRGWCGPALYTYTNTYMPRFSPSGFFRPSRYLIPTPGLTSEYPVCAACVCVCVYTHTYPHTLPPALKNRETQTTPPSLLQSKMTHHAKP